MATIPESRQTHVAPFIQWDVLEEHLQEAAFLWTQRERALSATSHVLEEVLTGDEARLFAHMEGLLNGGVRVARRLLCPALQEGDEGTAAVAACVLLASSEEDWRGAVLDALVARESPDGLLRAIGLSPRGDLDAALLERFPRLAPPLQSGVLEVLTFRQTAPDAALALLPRSHENPALWAAALRAARFAARPLAVEFVRRGLAEPEPRVQQAAIESGCILGERAAWLLCRRLCETSGSSIPRQALLALAVGGDGPSVELLVKRLGSSDETPEILWALSFSGAPLAAEAAWGLLRSTGEPLAAEVLAAVYGLPLQTLADTSLPDEAPEEEEQDEAQQPEASGLPGPTASAGRLRLDAVEAWWNQVNSRFERTVRYIHGQPWSQATMLMALESAPLVRRPALAWELAVRTRGTHQVETGQWAHRQLRQIAALTQTRSPFMTGSFPNFMST